MFSRYVVSIICLVFFVVSPVSAEKNFIKPSENDKCPVCGMFVAKFPEMLSEIIFNDGTYAVFDGPKDMFRYYLNMKKYNPSKTVNDIDSIYVTEYYNVTHIDGRKAYYVIGSDVYGPMGRELVAFLNEKDASQFIKDHGGKILRFGDINEAVLKTLE